MAAASDSDTNVFADDGAPKAGGGDSSPAYVGGLPVARQDPRAGAKNRAKRTSPSANAKP